MVFGLLSVLCCVEDGQSDNTHLAVIDVTNGTNVDVRLVALKGRGVGPGRVDECLTPQGGLERVD